MKSDVYHIVTVQDGRRDAAAILRIFADMAAGHLKPDITLLNYYNEVPVSYASTVRSVEQDGVELLVHRNQAVIMKKENSTLIKSRHFHNGLAVHCYATYVSIPKKTVILHNFAYAQIRAERREAVRVRVIDPLPVQFTWEEGTVTGSIITISGTGVSFRAPTPPSMRPEQQGVLSFMVMGVPLKIPATFVRGVSRGEHHWYIMQMQPDRNSETAIGTFIYRRQVEIIQELKDGFLTEDCA